MADNVITDTIARWRAASERRGLWMHHWDDLARVFLPRRRGFVTEQVPGDSRMDTIFDGSGMRACRGLANAIGGMLRPEGQKWFFLKASEDQVDNTDEAKDWLEEAREDLYAAFNNPKARFRQATGEADEDLAALGTAVVFVGENRNLDALLFQTAHLKDAVPFFSEDGVVDGMFRERRYTLRQAMDKFGLDSLSENTRNKAEDSKALDDKIRMLHAILPRDEMREPTFARNMPYASRWIEIDASHEVANGGFQEFPFAVPRWDTSSGEDYGRSPGMIALPDANTLQAMGETILVAGQRAADPPLLVPDDGFFDEANAFPGGLSYYDIDTAKALGRIPIEALNTEHNLPISRDMQQDTREQVFAAFFRNVLNLPVEGPQMTATEVIQRKEEFIREIGPVFGRLETDYTGPMVERAFQIMLRAGALPPIPDVLQGQSIRFEYESPVRKIREQVEAAAARLWVAEMVDLGQVKPEALDLIDVDGYGRFTAEAAAIPGEIVASQETVQAIREARAEALQQAQEEAKVAASMEVADTAASAAQKAGLTNQAA